MSTVRRHSSEASWRTMLSHLTKRRAHSEVTKKNLNRSWTRFNDGWYGEIVAVLFSLACSIAIVVVLLVYNNKPTPKLSKGITLNAIVSILATASKTALLFTTSSCLGQLKWIWFKAEKARSLAHAQIFDDASRGPLGALELFGSEPRMSVASVGAILTFLALAYDPFLQQVINISPEVRYSASNDVVTKQATRFMVSPGEQRSLQALNAGIYTDRFDRSPACSTGNCTFPRFSSVGWCCTCSQSTDWTFDDGCSLIFNDTGFSLESNQATSIINHTCRLTSGSGNSRIIPLQAFRVINDAGGTSWIDLPPFQITTEFAPKPYLQNPRFPWGGRVPMGEWSFTYFKIVDWSLAVDSVDVCTLDLCLRDYEVAVDGGTTRTVASNERFGRRYFRSHNFTEIAWQEFRHGEQSHSYICWEPDGAPKNSSWKFENIEGTPLYASPADFAFCADTLTATWSWADQIASTINWNHTTALGFSNGTGTGHFNNTNLTIYNYYAETSYTSYNGSVTFSDPIFDAQYIDGTTPSSSTIRSLGLQTVMYNIAASLSELMIRDPFANDVTGYLGLVETVVHVQWEWLALPAFLVTGATLFLILTIMTNSCSTTPIWKSSINALLYHGLAEGLDEHPDLLTMSSMDNMAASTNVFLTASRTSARLVLVNQSQPANHTMLNAPSESTDGIKKQAVSRATTI